MSEVVEHASEALAPLLVNLVLRLPAQVEQVRGWAEDGTAGKVFCRDMKDGVRGGGSCPFGV